MEIRSSRRRGTSILPVREDDEFNALFFVMNILSPRHDVSIFVQFLTLIDFMIPQKLQPSPEWDFMTKDEKVTHKRRVVRVTRRITSSREHCCNGTYTYSLVIRMAIRRSREVSLTLASHISPPMLFASLRFAALPSLLPACMRWYTERRSKNGATSARAMYASMEGTNLSRMP